MTTETTPEEDLIDLLCEGIHTGLRKGTDAEDSHDLWVAIARSETSAWPDAITWAVDCLQEMGYRIVPPGQRT